MVDLTTFIILGIVFLLIAVKHRRKNSETDRFHIANWSASSIAIIASVIALFGAGEISTFTELYSFFGSGISVFFIGAATGFIAVYALGERFYSMITSVRRLDGSVKKSYHINDVIHDRYGKLAMLVFSVLAVFSLLALYLIQVIVGSDLIAIGAGVSYSHAVIGISGFVALYVIISGLEGIYSTDKIQLFALFISLILIAYTAMIDFNISVVGEMTSAFSRLDLTTGLTLFFPGFFAVVGADVMQRFISAKSSSDLKRITIASALGWLFLGCTVVIFSAGIANYSLDGSSGFLEFLNQAQGAVRVIVIVGLTSALLSTADTEAHSVALLVNRAIQPNKPPSVKTSRVIIGAVCVLGCVIALYFKDLSTLYSFMLNLFLILGPIVFAVVLGRGNAKSVCLTMIIATALLLYFIISDEYRGTEHLLGMEVLLLAVITATNLLVSNRSGI